MLCLFIVSKPQLFDLEADCTVDDRQISIIENEYGIVFPDSYKNLIKNYGGGYFGFIAFYSFDQNSPFDLSKNVSVKLIKELMLLPVVDLLIRIYTRYLFQVVWRMSQFSFVALIWK